MSPQFDVLIVGAGVIGSAAARELSRYKLTIGVLEKTPGSAPTEFPPCWASMNIPSTPVRENTSFWTKRRGICSPSRPNPCPTPKRAVSVSI